MALPFFYKEDINLTATDVVLDEATSKHIVQVLRMQKGEQLQLTNGKGNLFTAEITDDNRKKCGVTIIEKSEIANPKSKIAIAISLIKNNSRFEWFLEKATEIGVTEIIPLICERTEKSVFKIERSNGILISAMLQSQQSWLPVLRESQKFAAFIGQAKQEQKFIAHCIDENNKAQLASQPINPDRTPAREIHSGGDVHPDGQLTNKLILIGPEGDFTKEEIEYALKHGFTPVSLGNTRLRTETAGIVAASILATFK
jgi:16S rRNA (uracil1498-N3)-methyltransferase